MAANTSSVIRKPAPQKEHSVPQQSRVLAFVNSEPGRWILLAAFCGFLFFYGIFSGEFWRTESLRAIVAAEFLRSGNWIVPTLYGEPIFTKPPGMYAAIALISLPFGGVHEWTARLPSALAATATVFLFYGFLRRFLGGRLALAGALILPTSLMWLDKASTAEIDMFQVFWVAAALICFFRAIEIEEQDSSSVASSILGYRVLWSGRSIVTVDQPLEKETLAPALGGSPALTQKVTSRNSNQMPSKSWWGSAGWWWMAALLFVAGGVLTKWTAPAFFYLTALGFLWQRKRLGSLFSRRHLLSALLAGSICCVWIGLAAWQGGWSALRDTVSQEALMRLSPTHHHRAYPWFEALAHPFKLLASTLPWSFFALFTLYPGFTKHLDDRGKFLLSAFHAWAWPSLIFWSVVPEHSPRQSFPLFPGIAGLATLFFVAWIRGKISFGARIKPWPVLTCLVIAWLGVKVVFVQAVMPHRNKDRLPQAKGEMLARLVPENQTLYIFRLKDEGIMFYYGRTVRRLRSMADLPVQTEPMYCILDGEEWAKTSNDGRVQVIQNLRDEQGAPIALARIEGPLRELR
jgi:4-amino-4-deoxy-L-arabinose transferase-like glycosyltransferase